MSDDTRERYEPAAIEPQWQQVWDEHEHLPRRAAPRQEEALHPRHVPVPVGLGPARRPSRGVHGDRHRGALLAHARRGRPASHGLGRVRSARPSSTPSRPTRTRATRRHEHRDVQAPAQDARLQLRLVARDRHDRSRLRPLDAVDSSSSSSRRASPTRRRSPSTGARRSAPCSPTKRSSTARASGEGTPWSASRCGSGCSRSPRTPIASTRTSTGLDWPDSTGPSSTTGSAAARARRSTSTSSARPGRTHSRLHDAGRHAARA